MNIIEAWKTNTSAFGLVDPRMREVAEKIGTVNLEYYDPCFGVEWNRNWSSNKIDARDIVRLRADYACQHPETKRINSACGVSNICLWCDSEIQQEKKAGWVTYEISIENEEYIFDRRIRLWAAPGMVGFGGIRYEAPCECYGGGTTDWSYNPPDPCETHGPWRPVSVRFWKEPTK